MNLFSKFLKLAAISLFIVTIPACQYIIPSKFNNTERTPGNKVDDQIIKNQIIKEVKSKGIGKLSHINVAVYNAIVLISGESQDSAIKQQITNIARKIYKVRKAYNVTRISAPSSLVARSSDSVITAAIKAQIFRFPETRSSKVKVVTESGVVYLMGLVSENEATKIVRTVSGVKGVQKIVKLFEITR